MFEFDKKIVESLLRESEDFKSLYVRHDELKELVHEAEQGSSPMDDAALGTMKKEKLLTKDKMAAIIEDYRKTHEVHH